MFIPPASGLRQRPVDVDLLKFAHKRRDVFDQAVDAFLTPATKLFQRGRRDFRRALDIDIPCVDGDEHLRALIFEGVESQWVDSSAEQPSQRWIHPPLAFVSPAPDITDPRPIDRERNRQFPYVRALGEKPRHTLLPDLPPFY